MKGKLISTNCPYLRFDLIVDLKKRIFSETQIEALFDSGFSGDVAIPGQLVGNGKAPPPEGYARFKLANGAITSAPVYIGSVVFRELIKETPNPIEVSVLVMGDEVLVGRGLMDHFRVILDHGKQLIVES